MGDFFDDFEKEMNFLLQDFISMKPFLGFARRDVWAPPMNVYETKEGLVVVLEIAGVDRKSFRATLNGNHLVITGKRDVPAPKGAKHYSLEIPSGAFGRRVILPFVVDATKVRVVEKKGFVKIFLPRLKEEEEITIRYIKVE